MDYIEGAIEKIIYYSPDTGYTVCKFALESGEKFTIVGSFPPLSAGEVLRINGKWEIIDLDSSNIINMNWIANPNYSKIPLIALQTEIEFIISMNLQSESCSNGKMIIYIDGFPVVDKNNKPIKFSEGSSVRGIGKVIEVRTEGNCNNNTVGFIGQIKFRKKK